MCFLLYKKIMSLVIVVRNLEKRGGEELTKEGGCISRLANNIGWIIALGGGEQICQIIAQESEGAQWTARVLADAMHDEMELCDEPVPACDDACDSGDTVVLWQTYKTMLRHERALVIVTDDRTTVGLTQAIADELSIEDSLEEVQPGEYVAFDTVAGAYLQQNRS